MNNKKISKKVLTSMFIAFSMLSYGANSNFSNDIYKPNEVISNSAGNAVISREYNSVSQDFRQKYIILHYTAINKEGSLRALTEKDVSSHFLISDQEGDPIYALVPEDKRAWHAGVSTWKTRTNLNDSSLGIEIVNLGQSSGGDFIPYKESQIEQVAVLVKYLANKYEIPAENILGHSDIAPQRKPDPGALFPWKRLYDEYGIGMWYDENTKINYESLYYNSFYNVSIYEMQNELKKFGYAIDLTGQFDKQTENVIKAFQYHFRPSFYDGKMDVETFSILKALNEKYNNK